MLQAKPAKNIMLAKAQPSKSGFLEYVMVYVAGKACKEHTAYKGRVVMVYVAGKACKEHNACEGTAFEEWNKKTKLAKQTIYFNSNSSVLFGLIRNGNCFVPKAGFFGSTG